MTSGRIIRLRVSIATAPITSAVATRTSAILEFSASSTTPIQPGEVKSLGRNAVLAIRQESRPMRGSQSSVRISQPPPARYHIRSKRQHIPDNEGRGEHQNRYRYSRPSSHRATTCRRSDRRSITGQYRLATATTQAAKAGDVISLYGNGFGTTNPPVAPGKVGATEAPVAKPVTVTIGGHASAHYIRSLVCGC